MRIRSATCILDLKVSKIVIVCNDLFGTYAFELESDSRNCMVIMDKILVVDKITKEYPGRTAVSEVSFEVHKGSIHGFLGPNGAGKSTTMRMIAGLMPATSGTMTLFGDKISPQNMGLKN